MARKPGQIIARGANIWLVRVYQGRDSQTGTRKYHNQTIHGSLREAQRFLNLKLQQRDPSRASRPAAVTLNLYLDQRLENVAKTRLRARTFHDYESLLRLYIRPALGTRLIGSIGQMDIQRALRTNVRARIVSEDDPVHERCARIGLSAGSSLENAGGGPLRWRRPAACETP